MLRTNIAVGNNKESIESKSKLSINTRPESAQRMVSMQAESRALQAVNVSHLWSDSTSSTFMSLIPTSAIVAIISSGEIAMQFMEAVSH